MYYHNIHMALQEVPGEISVCFSISGCQLQCEGCHSPFLWKAKTGKKLTEAIYLEILNKYKGLATCVLFMGGEWHPERLAYYLKMARNKGYKTCLYTGEDAINPTVLKNLTWLKTGSWQAELGGLDSSTTNQKFIEVQSNTQLNHLFIKTP
ncbi:anaerobic ribonucleoside-triphosphate reductase activating protein [Tamlana sp. I1]|uniref:anaerobic ribonucleoside-triphosphate reductase activating protein n=1 Tax=Tamlana sp. I1 TaxID=2762061 RepID=UPI001890456B|nr:anaerobic ribonucleoside-triphosphate reductase activating protein [Tamlana sp. I1]